MCPPASALPIFLQYYISCIKSETGEMLNFYYAMPLLKDKLWGGGCFFCKHYVIFSAPNIPAVLHQLHKIRDRRNAKFLLCNAIVERQIVGWWVFFLQTLRNFQSGKCFCLLTRWVGGMKKNAYVLF